ncbi:DedA family protein [Moraxella sp. FZFQ2102]|uniref:DedA family protein n=1 Tax=Moraxella sp. FZFQ2102 TaxID=2953752 RepID=UPI00209C41A2|nr:DedA family protein [Moraxella sp. FZFQ2102]USZ14189.1 DedA family protein [Moraxella sp. FZFQ2102]
MTHLSDWVLLMMDKLGLFGVALMMFLENVFPPIPSELIMPAAGFAAAMGRMELWLVIAAGTAGSVIGALPLYYLGTLLDEQRLFALMDKYGKYLLLTRDDIIKAQSWFDRYGNSVIFFGRMIPAIRSLISIPAGMARMPMLPFLLLTTLGSAIWSALLAYAGFVLGANYQKVADYIAPISSAVGWIVGVALLFIILIRLKKFLKN